MIPGIVAGGANVFDAFRVGITVPDASIAETLTDFPVYVDLSGMPSGFWTHLARDDGGDIRVKNGAGTQLPFDLLWIDIPNQRGALFYKQTLTDGGSTVAYIHYGNPYDQLLAVGATYGRNAVWSDYEAVFTFGDDNSDRTGKRLEVGPAATNMAITLENTTTSADLGVHQGIAWDGTYYYAIDTNAIKKYNAAFSLQSSNTNPVGDVNTATGGTTNHLGDACIHNGMLYVVVENYVNISTWSQMKVARFDPATLALIDVFDIAANAHEVSSICYCPKDGLMYITSYADNTKLHKYDPDDLSYQGYTSLTGVAHAQFQGITWWRNSFWINADETSNKCTFKCEYSGVKRNKAYYTTGGSYEGIDKRGDEALIALHDTTGSANGVVKRLIPYRTAHAGGGANFNPTNNEAFLATSVAKLTNWSLGVSVNLAAVGQNRAFVSYDVSGSASTADRATIAYRNATTNFGLWNTTDSWLLDTITPSTGTLYRLHATHNGTTDRKIYRNGGNVQTDSGVAQKPSGSANALYIGVENTVSAEDMSGLLGFVYLRSGVLSANWIAAEYSNLNAPGSFYTVGSEEAL